jgi:hypothetical protein
MIKKSLPFVALVLLVAASLALPAEQKKSKPPASGKNPDTALNCPDVAVTSLTATLVSTLLGDLQVEFPMDTVRVEATLENLGSAAVPPGTSLYLILKKNGTVIQSASTRDILGAPGSRWTYSVDDSFPHGRKTTYVFQVATTLRECLVNNNQATRKIDEKKLHPAGNPDLIVSVFSIGKRWKRSGDRFDAFFDLEADVTNIGSGYSNSDSCLLFVQNDDQVVLATVNIAQDDLPGPGEKKRFLTQLSAAQVPPGDFLVSAYIEKPRNERISNNNWSRNTGQISNNSDSPAGALAVIDFKPWRLSGKELSANIQITNLQERSLQNLQLVMLKDNRPVKTWQLPEFGPMASSHIVYSEERLPPLAVFGRQCYRAILTGAPGTTAPSGETVFDSRTRNLYWLEISEKILQDTLQHKDNGLAAQVYRRNRSFRISEAQATVGPEGILIKLKGRRIAADYSASEFRVETVLLPRLVLGQVELEAVKTVVHLGSVIPEFFSTLLGPVMHQAIKNIIEKYAAEELSDNLAKTSSGAFNQDGKNQAPTGFILTLGALGIYY